MSGPGELRRTRMVTSPTMEIHLPPEIALAVRIAAEAAGMSAESLITDILRDAFEPVFAGRGQIAVQKKPEAA